METSEIIKKVRRIELRSRRKASNLFLGEYKSSFKGRGMIFSETRLYQYGDDVRNIDWNTTARYNEPYIKVFQEERELTMILAVDVSGSQNFGTRKQFKSETVIEICATLALSAITFNDKVGLILFTDEVELFIPPRKGKKHVLRIIRELVNFEPKGKSNNLSNTLKFLIDTFKRKSNVFLFSDYLDESNYLKNLKIAAKKHDITGIRIFDEKETFFPDVGLITLVDNETGERKTINSSSALVRKDFRDYYARITYETELIFKQAGAGYKSIRADDDYVKHLLNYFKRHAVK